MKTKRIVFLFAALAVLLAVPPVWATTLPAGKGVLVDDGTTSGAANKIRWPNGTISSLTDGVATIDLATLGGGDMSAATWAPSGFLDLTHGTTAGAQRTVLGLAIGTNVQAWDADLTTWAGITPSANIQNVFGAANYGAMRTLLSLVPGTDVQAYDAELAALAGLTSAADALPYFTGSGTA